MICQQIIVQKTLKIPSKKFLYTDLEKKILWLLFKVIIDFTVRLGEVRLAPESGCGCCCWVRLYQLW